MEHWGCDQIFLIQLEELSYPPLTLGHITLNNRCIPVGSTSLVYHMDHFRSKYYIHIC